MANQPPPTSLVMTLGLFVAIFNAGAYGLNVDYVSGPSTFVWVNSAPPLQGLLHKPIVHLRSKNNAPRGIRHSKNLRAMLDVGDLFKGAVPPSESVLRAVEYAGRRVTVADIASAVGMSVSDSQTALSTLAMLTGGTLEVSKYGDIVYNFDPNFRNILRTRSTQVTQPYK
jgi:hypothetical protein